LNLPIWHKHFSQCISITSSKPACSWSNSAPVWLTGCRVITSHKREYSNKKNNNNNLPDNIFLAGCFLKWTMMWQHFFTRWSGNQIEIENKKKEFQLPSLILSTRDFLKLFLVFMSCVHRKKFIHENHTIELRVFISVTIARCVQTVQARRSCFPYLSYSQARKNRETEKELDH
jgi:hypothetical protein